jgi:outer membrane receptor protein involved in Fe transport
METATVFKKLQADSCVSNEARAGLQQLALQEAGEKKKSNVSKRGLDPHRITGEQLDKLSLSNTVDAVKMLPGVVMMSNRLTLRGGIQSIGGNLSDVEPLLIVDGVNTRAGSVVDYLNSIPPSNIDYIEVLTGPEAALYGSRGGNGAIVVKTSNKLRDSKLYEGKEKQTITATGFYKEQPFFESGYDNYSVREAVFTDNRATIYWNGQLITDDAGKAAFSFYTADLKHDYTLTVQGITDKGEVIFKTVTIKRR